MGPSSSPVSVFVLLLGVLRTKEVLTGPQSIENELSPVAQVQVPHWLLVLVIGGMGAEQIGGRKAGNRHP